MEKYAVEVDKEQTKTATKGGIWYCTSCGTRVDPNSNVPKCPSCGTEPFEKKKKN